MNDKGSRCGLLLFIIGLWSIHQFSNEMGWIIFGLIVTILGMLIFISGGE